jgi:hypothetical protein
MPLVVPGLVEPKSKQEQKPLYEDKKDDVTQTKSSEDKSEESKSATTKKVDGRTAPGMEGMSEEAVKRFEEAMELEYQKREGGA